MLNRDGLKELSRLRRREALSLLRSSMPAGAYYLVGYSVECALKACVARSTKRYDFPEKTRVAESYTHDLSRLLKLAGLQPALDQATSTSPAFEANWAVVKDWKETSRYNGTITVKQAQSMYKAVTARRAGVLTWLRQHW